MTAQDGRDGSFRAIVRRALTKNSDCTPMPDPRAVANAILDELHTRGLAIHDPVNCVRRPWQDRTKDAAMPPIETVGRAMTDAELLAFGLVSDDVP